jgi:hypothetical protein
MLAVVGATLLLLLVLVIPLSATVCFLLRRRLSLGGCHCPFLVDCYRCPLILVLPNPCFWCYRIAAFGAVVRYCLLFATSAVVIRRLSLSVCWLIATVVICC